MNISFLKNLKLTCCEATLLLEQKNAHILSFRKKIQLNFHLLICKYCAAYNKKLTYIEKFISPKTAEKNIPINDNELNEFKDKINKKLNL